MKITIIIAVSQLFLIGSGRVVPGEPKRVGCYYLGIRDERNETIYPEDLDVTICSHLVYIKGRINNETGEIQIMSKYDERKTDDEGFIPRLVKMKEMNPDLKLILLIGSVNIEMFITDPSKETNVIENGVRWLNESGFDGLQISFTENNVVWEKMGDLLCAMKSEFDKYGYMLTAMISDQVVWEATIENEEPISKMERCSDYVTLLTGEPQSRVHRLAPMHVIKSNVDRYIKRGLSADKINIIIPAVAVLVQLEDQNETEANTSTTENYFPDVREGIPISYNELLRQLRNSSLEWTIRYDENTKEPYAYSKTGLWTSYEDTVSMSFKARYVQEKGLMGLALVALDKDDEEGLEGEGRFPLTRAVYNTFRGQNQSVEATS